MRRVLSLGLIIVFFSGMLAACGSGSPSSDQEAALLADAPSLVLEVRPQAGTYNSVGQPVNYQYIVTNKGSTVLPGPVTVADNKTTVTCPAVNTVGNTDNNLDPAEAITCVSTYPIAQADMNAGAVISIATATAGGVVSSAVTTTVPMTLSKVLELISSANPSSYNNSGQQITFSHTIKNTSAGTLGPAQFTLRDDRLGTLNCLGNNATLAPGASLSCTNTYTTTEGDRSAGSLTFNLTASGGGATSIQTVTLTVTNTAVTTGPTPSANLVKGATIVHEVKEGEWMLQIARCYGADLNAVRTANPQVKDPARIWPIEKLTIPNIGSNGTIYGPPCIEYITAQSGETWETIAQKYNARVDVLKEANQGISTVTAGARIRVPRNSAGGNPITGGPGEAVRLNLIPGANAVPQSGTVTTSEGRDRYVFTASQGQTLTVRITAPAGGLDLAVLLANGTAVKARDISLNWSGTLPSNGEYYIDIFNTTSSDKQYTLEASLAAPPSAAERVADINAGVTDSNPSYLEVFNNALYFSARGADNAGTELWKYDGSSPSRAADIFSGAESSNPSFLTTYNGHLYFGANGNDGNGVELWRYNGSAFGRLTEINAGGGNANPSHMTVFNGLLYFSASDGINGTEIWQTDGTTYRRVSDIYSGPGDSNPSYLTVFNNVLYFSATSNDGYGTELWKYDGTNAPSRVSDINPGVGNAAPAYLTVFNNILYFSANAGDGFGTELWKYDGTSAPSRAADINVGAGDSTPAYLVEFNGALYFSANGNDGKGYELWRYNGTTASLAADINKSGDSFPSFLTVYNGQLYFQANGGDNAGRELWRFKGP